MKKTLCTLLTCGTILLSTAATSLAQDFVFEEHPTNENELRVFALQRNGLPLQRNGLPPVDSEDSGVHDVEAVASLADSDINGTWLHADMVGINPYGQSVMSLSSITEHSFTPSPIPPWGTNLRAEYGIGDPNDTFCYYWAVIDSPIYPANTPCTIVGSIDMSWGNATPNAGATTSSGTYEVYAGGNLIAWLNVVNGTSATMSSWPYSATFDPDSDGIQVLFEEEVAVGDEVYVRFRATHITFGQGDEELVSTMNFDVNLMVDD